MSCMLGQKQEHFVKEWFDESKYWAADSAYSFAAAMNELLPKNPEDIQKLVEHIETTYSGERLLSNFGIFISACVNKSVEEGIELDVDIPFSYMGFRNNNEVLVNGNLGKYAGEQMIGGKLTINGDAGKYLGNKLCGGKIIVTGSCDERPGYRMRGGEIIIKGSCGGHIAPFAKGGTIRLYGDYSGIDPTSNATVYYKDILLERSERIVA